MTSSTADRCRPDRVSVRGPWLALPLLAACLLGGPAEAQYKIVGPDGKVTYTDRPTSLNDGSKVSSVRGGAVSDVATSTPLPPELRQVAQRYPVVLYTMPDCAPCNDARTLLRTRGVPFNERLVTSSEDSESLQRLTGTREAPSLNIGAQTLRGLSPDTWNAYLDSAGYPRESRLPASYQYPIATPLTERRQVAAPAPARNAGATLVPQASEAPAPGPNGSPNPGIRF